MSIFPGNWMPRTELQASAEPFETRQLGSNQADHRPDDDTDDNDFAIHG
jgi:hypothetical protein